MSPYAVLEISSRASEEEIRKAYKVMAKKWHPDRKLDDQETATKKFKEIDAAYRAILHERHCRTETRKHSSGPSSTSSSSSTTKSPDDNGHPSKTKNTSDFEQLDSANSRVENAHDERCRREEKVSSRPKNKPGSRSCTNADSRRSFNSSASSASTSTVSSSSSSSSSTSSVPSKTWVASPSTKPESNLPKSSPHISNSPDGQDKQAIDHASSSMPPLTSFTLSITSSEVSAYDHPEITLPPLTNSSSVIAAAAVHENEAKINEAEIDPVSGTMTSISPSTQPKDSEKSRQDKHSSPSKMFSSSPKRNRGDDDDSGHTLIPEFNSSLARSVGVFKQWTYTLRLNLTDLFHGKRLHFHVIRCKSSSGKRKTSLLKVDIPQGSRHGTQIIFKSAGHGNVDGSRQDLHFVVEEERHERFKRLGDDLILDVRLPWNEGLKREKGMVNVTELLDGSKREFEVDFVGEGNMGEERIEGAGMPVFGVKGKRGCLIVRWEIFMPDPPTKWAALKQVLKL